MSKLIGTSPNQVPSNADLGTAAFADVKDFLLARGNTVEAVDSIINIDCNDVFIYDTTLDSDGGAWRKRTQNTSWYTEEIGVANRGNRREFPQVALLVSGDTPNDFIIYDADDITLPHWMTFKNDGYLSWATSGTPVVNASKAVNGVIAVATNTGGMILDFIEDSFMIVYESLDYVLRSRHNIAGRNDVVSWTTDTFTSFGPGTQSHKLRNSNMNCVDMIVRAGAPVNPATGLPIPMIAFGHSNGIGIIHETNNSSVGERIITNIWGTDGADTITQVDFINDTTIGWWNSNHYSYSIRRIPFGDTSVSGSIHSTSEYRYSGHDVLSGFRLIPSSGGGASGGKSAVLNPNTFAIGGSKGVTLIDRNTDIPEKGMAAYTTTEYATGWMPGDIKMAHLAETTQGTTVEYSINHVTNGDFASSVTGWSGDSNEGGSLSWNPAGYATITRGTGDSTYAMAQNIGSLSAGDQVYVKFSVMPNNTGRMRVRLGGSTEEWSSTSLTANSWQTIEFVSTMKGGRIEIASNGGAGITSFSVDNIEIRKVVPDRSVEQDGMAVAGTLMRSPVAPGADVVSYSGFSSANYLFQPEYSAGPVLGSASQTWIGWFKIGAVSGEQCILDITGGCVARIRIMPTTSQLSWYLSDYTTGVACTTTFNVDDYTWHQFVATYQNGMMYLYLDGKLVAYNNHSGGPFNRSSTAPFKIGAENSGTPYPFNGEIALIRFTNTILNFDQIQKMYYDEKKLFEKDAKCTLTGTSTIVNAIEYDKYTELLHVGTSSGRSSFSGLLRVEETDEPVAKTIAASKGFIVED